MKQAVSNFGLYGSLFSLSLSDMYFFGYPLVDNHLGEIKDHVLTIFRKYP